VRVCYSCRARREAIGRPFSQLTRQTRYNRKRFFLSLLFFSDLHLLFLLSIIPSLPTIASPHLNFGNPAIRGWCA
jgi:hypothetical protein